MAKFLFYLEPFPIRNSYVSFCTVPDNIKTALTGKYDSAEYTIYANKQTLARIATNNPNYIDHFILPTGDENRLFNSQLFDWDTKGIALWLDLMKESDISRQYIQIIKNIYHRNPFDHIVCWGTNYAVKQAAKELGTGFIAMELGCSRLPYMDSLAADPMGVNGGASFAHADISSLDFLSPSDANTDLLTCNNFYSLAYESKFAYMYDDRPLNIIGNKKVAFIALQLYDDANMKAYSPYQSVKAILEDILPKLANAGYSCIIKEHPATHLRYGASAANEEAELYAKNFNNIIWIKSNAKNISNSKLYELSSLIITVNSSSGFEALFFNKPVVILGEAVYKPSGCFPTLDEYLAGNFNEENYLNNIGKIRRFFLEDYLIPRDKAQNPKWLFDRLTFIGKMSQQDLSPNEIIHAFHQYAVLKSAH